MAGFACTLQCLLILQCEQGNWCQHEVPVYFVSRVYFSFPFSVSIIQGVVRVTLNGNQHSGVYDEIARHLAVGSTATPSGQQRVVDAVRCVTVPLELFVLIFNAVIVLPQSRQRRGDCTVTKPIALSRRQRIERPCTVGTTHLFTNLTHSRTMPWLVLIRDEVGLHRVVHRAVEMRNPRDPGWRPTIIAEIDRNGTDVVINTVAKALKRVCADQRDAHVILVLSDATSVFYLPADLNRQTFV